MSEVFPAHTDGKAMPTAINTKELAAGTTPFSPQTEKSLLLAQAEARLNLIQGLRNS